MVDRAAAEQLKAAVVLVAAADSPVVAEGGQAAEVVADDPVAVEVVGKSEI